MMIDPQMSAMTLRAEAPEAKLAHWKFNKSNNLQFWSNESRTKNLCIVYVFSKCHISAPGTTPDLGTPPLESTKPASTPPTLGGLPRPSSCAP